MSNKKLMVLPFLTLVLASCGGNTSTSTTTSGGPITVPDINTFYNAVDPAEVTDPYFNKSAGLYNAHYGQFWKNYQSANTASSVSERYAYQAIAEAKLLESGTMLPGCAEGGNYSISRVVPRTVSPVYWGLDNARFHNALVLNGNPLTKDERQACLDQYAKCSTQSEYVSWVKKYFGDKGRTFNKTYTQYYNGDPETYDVLASYYAADAEPLCNTFDGLVEYDGKNAIQPALAESWTKSADGKSYTFTIRSGATWVDKDGNRVDDVKADDFVAGFQHMLDAAGGLEYLVDGVVAGAHEYLEAEGAEKNFENVGVKASGNQVTYTLTKDYPYFETMLSYAIFAPLCRSYYTSQGGKFGGEFDPTAASYQYAKDYDHIVNCGPYIVKTYTKENTFEFKKNESYWNKANIEIDTIVWLNNDGEDPLKAYNGAKDGTVVGAGLNTNAIAQAKTDGWFNDYAYVSDCNANSYPFYINLNRAAYANSNDPTVGVSAKTEAQKAKAEAAMKNVYIRLGLCFSIDRSKYYAPSVGEELALNAVTNSYTPATFVKTTEEVTINIGGKDVKFAAGTYYGEFMQAQINADGLPIKVYDANTQSGFSFDGWHNADAAVAYLNKGISQLQASGVVITTADPLVIDLTTASAVATTDNAIKAVGQTIEATFGGLVKVNYVDCGTRKNMLYAEYYPDRGDETNCDIMTISGWGPDYGDPSTYLDTFLPQTGGMLKCSGIY